MLSHASDHRMLSERVVLLVMLWLFKVLQGLPLLAADIQQKSVHSGEFTKYLNIYAYICISGVYGRTQFIFFSSGLPNVHQFI
jgi:hypothetical protein